jgi:signal transduction histidine kinase
VPSGSSPPHRPDDYARASKVVSAGLRAPPFVAVNSTFVGPAARGWALGSEHDPVTQMVGRLVTRTLPHDDPTRPPTKGPRTGREKAVDAAGCLVAAVLGALLLSPQLGGPVHALSTTQLGVDVLAGTSAGALLWWRRRWPLGVALACLALGTFSISATPAGLVALFSVAVHRPFRSALLVAALWVPSALLFSVYSQTTDPVSVVVVLTPLVLAATAWGMFIRARRQLILSLHERALRAEADRRLREEQARMAERTRIAREMHDVLAHRISLLALHAGGLEVRPDLPATQVRETAQLLRSTARQALEELRSVIGVLREDPGGEQTQSAPQPTLSDIARLVDQTRQAGAHIEFAMVVQDVEAAPSGLGRDAYRIVQEALTNIGKHAGGSSARVRVTGAPEKGLHISVRNRQPVHSDSGPALPGSGTGLLGLQERVALTGGTLVHGPDGLGDFVVEADLAW